MGFSQRALDQRFLWSCFIVTYLKWDRYSIMISIYVQTMKNSKSLFFGKLLTDKAIILLPQNVVQFFFFCVPLFLKPGGAKPDKMSSIKFFLLLLSLLERQDTERETFFIFREKINTSWVFMVFQSICLTGKSFKYWKN